MARTDPQINLRIPAELKDRVTEVAQSAGRSTNAEIVQRLEDSIAAGPEASELMAGMASLSAAEKATEAAYWLYVQASGGDRTDPSKLREKELTQRAWSEATVREMREARRVADLILDLCRLHDRVADRLFPDGIPDL